MDDKKYETRSELRAAVQKRIGPLSDEVWKRIRPYWDPPYGEGEVDDFEGFLGTAKDRPGAEVNRTKRTARGSRGQPRPPLGERAPELHERVAAIRHSLGIEGFKAEFTLGCVKAALREGVEDRLKRAANLPVANSDPLLEDPATWAFELPPLADTLAEEFGITWGVALSLLLGEERPERSLWTHARWYRQVAGAQAKAGLRGYRTAVKVRHQMNAITGKDERPVGISGSANRRMRKSRAKKDHFAALNRYLEMHPPDTTP